MNDKEVGELWQHKHALIKQVRLCSPDSKEGRQATIKELEMDVALIRKLVEEAVTKLDLIQYGPVRVATEEEERAMYKHVLKRFGIPQEEWPWS